MRRSRSGPTIAEEPALVNAEPVDVADRPGCTSACVRGTSRTAREGRQAIHGRAAQGRGGAERDQPDHRSDPQRFGRAAGQREDVVVEAVGLVPEALLVHRVGNVGEVLEELGREIL